MLIDHLTRVNVAAEGSTKKEWREIVTPNVSFPTTLDEVRALLDDPTYTRLVEVTFNEQSKTLKRVVKMPFLAKLVSDSIKLLTNAKAKSTLGIDPLVVAAEVLENPEHPQFMNAIKAMRAGKDAFKAWAEEFSAKQDNGVDATGDDGLEGDAK
jgi:hypothetical protein